MIMVSSAGMQVILKGARVTNGGARQGYDPGYYPGRAMAREKSAAGYHLNAAQGGEEPGRWFGPGAEALGFADGQVVQADPYMLVYAEQRDPNTGERMGRARGNYKQFDEHLARKLAVEPHATAERRLQLEREAAQETRRSPLYTDVTISHNKSVSVLHAAFREKARQAGLRGDREERAVWLAREARVKEILQEANHAGLLHMDEWGGWTRTGYHGKRQEAVETGRWARALPIVTTWLQGTSRAGEPHDHSHNVFARMAITQHDQKARTLDTRTLVTQIGHMIAIVDAHVQSALAREFGVRWEPRDDGKGHEIRGIGKDIRDLYSTRTVEVTGEGARLAAKWEAKYGRVPNAREMQFIMDEAHFTSRHGKEGTVDWDVLGAKWDATLGGQLAGIADAVCDFHGRRNDSVPSADVQQRAIDQAVARIQAGQSTWTESDFMQSLAWSMGDEFAGMEPAARDELMHEMAARAISVDGGVKCLEAEEWPPVPADLRRDLDNRSVYTRPGVTRYASVGQLDMETRLIQQARHNGAPSVSRETAARLLGADPDKLTALLHERAQNATELTSTGLRMDQAAMVFEALTSGKRVSVGVGPAGSGKTHTVAAGARAWESTGRRVVGVANSQAAANVLRRAGLSTTFNSSQFLGLRPGMPVAEGMPVDIGAGDLVIIDEGSALQMSHLARIVDLADKAGAKVNVIGDHEQLTSVESGGGMQLLANKLGYTQLAEPVRFAEQWERDASLRLRAGDKTAVEDYAEHGRIYGAEESQAFDQLRQRYVAGRLEGHDMILMARTRDDCRELSRQIREDLVHLGLVDAGQTVPLSDGAVASARDLIVQRVNDHHFITDGDHDLANGDMFVVESVRGTAAMVRRVIETSEGVRLADCPVRYGLEHLSTSDLGYAVTGHKGMGGTWAKSLSLWRGGESRQWGYVGLTRGRLQNVAFVVTHSAREEQWQTRQGEHRSERVVVPPKAADPAPGTLPAPELARHQRVMAERAGLPPEPQPPDDPQRDFRGVMADVLDRQEKEQSATEYARDSLVRADDLGVLYSRWMDLSREAEQAHFHQMITDALPTKYKTVDLGPQETWLHRTMRNAQYAGLDVQRVLDAAVNGSSLDGARNVASVVDARMRKAVGRLVPAPLPRWADRAAAHPEPVKSGYLHQVGQAMDDRMGREGAFAAESAPPWAVKALGPVPEDEAERTNWEERVGKLAAYRAIFGWSDKDDPIGPEPSEESPEQRAIWFDAFRAQASSPVLDLAKLGDKSLLKIRANYQTETRWAPPHVGKQLQAARMGADTAHAQAVRAEAEAKIAKDASTAAGHAALAKSAKALEAHYRERESILAPVQEDRELWDDMARGGMQLALAADAAYRQRHPKVQMPPLKSAEPTVPAPEDELWAPADTPHWVTELPAQRETFRAEYEARQGVRIPSEDPEEAHEGEAWTPYSLQQQAIQQPPVPQMQLSKDVVRATREAEA
jgi:AAA domain/TrwC relaxase